MENIKTEVKHSKSKSAWNVVGTILGGKYKIAICPYIQTDNEQILTRERMEAYDHAKFISDSFNNRK